MDVAPVSLLASRPHLSSFQVLAPKDGYSNRLLRRQLLQLLYEIVSLSFVVFGRPMIIEVIQDFYTTIKFVEKTSEHPRSTQRFHGIHHSTRKQVFKPY